MPPYGPQKARPRPRTRTLTVTVLACNWCHKPGAQPCRGCTLPTCYRCLASFEGGRCLHVTYVPAESTGWGTPCPNPMCCDECNVCKGQGFVW